MTELAWGDWLEIEPRNHIGALVYMRGVHELAVCELLWRLTEPSETVLDIGANIGVMTSLLSRRVGHKGRVLAFEAHPEIFQQLQQNVARWNRPWIELYQRAVSSAWGVVNLDEGDAFTVNNGTARVVEEKCEVLNQSGVAALADGRTPALSANTQLGPSCRRGPLTGRSFTVESVRLNEVLSNDHCGVAKIDVEGHEEHVLLGATDLLVTHRLRDVVFESTWTFPGPAHELLLADGYDLFEIGESLRGPVLEPVQKRSGPANRLADYLATTDAPRAEHLIARRGWQVLKCHRWPASLDIVPVGRQNNSYEGANQGIVARSD